MATIISLHIHSSDKMHIVKLLQELSKTEALTLDKYPAALDRSILIDDATPSFIAIDNTSGTWTCVYLNSFKKLHDWARHISKELDTSVIQLIGQTVSDCYCFLMYTKGTLRREIDIYHGEAEKAIDKGEKFPFENHILIPEKDEDFANQFGREHMEEYCKELGFDPFDFNSQGSFYILKKHKIGKTITSYLSKPWWKFW